MGRGMLNLKLISNPKSRRTTFQKRKKSLMKKAYELSTLCDVRTCVFIHGPSSNEAVDFETWPPNRNEIEGMIRAYKSHSSHTQSTRKSFDLNHFFSDRNAKIQTEISKLRDKIKHPNLDLDCFSEHQLKGLLGALDSKIGVVDGMIDFMEADYDHLIADSQCPPPPFTSSLETEFLQFPETEGADSQCPPPFSSSLETEFLQFPETEEIEELDVSNFFVDDFQTLLEDEDLQSLFQNNAFNFQYSTNAYC